MGGGARGVYRAFKLETADRWSRRDGTKARVSDGETLAKNAIPTERNPLCWTAVKCVAEDANECSQKMLWFIWSGSEEEQPSKTFVPVGVLRFACPADSFLRRKDDDVCPRSDQVHTFVTWTVPRWVEK
eukprot:scaffold609_cov170-Amphora_coffeaeformis.AAC.15